MHHRFAALLLTSAFVLTPFVSRAPDDLSGFTLPAAATEMSPSLAAHSISQSAWDAVWPVPFPPAGPDPVDLLPEFPAPDPFAGTAQEGLGPNIPPELLQPSGPPVASAIALIASLPVPSVTWDDLTATAEALLGTPYLWGGGTAKGMDCSALVSVIWGLSRQTTASLPKYGRVVAKDDLEPGDILNLTPRDDPRGYGHVRLFAGWADDDQTRMWVYEQTPPRAVYHAILYDPRYTPLRRIDFTEPGVTRLASYLADPAMAPKLLLDATPSPTITPTATLTPTVTLTPTATITATPSVTPEASITPTATAALVPTVAATATRTPAPRQIVCPRASPMPSTTPGATRTPIPTATPTKSPPSVTPTSVTPCVSPTPSATATASPTPTMVVPLGCELVDPTTLVTATPIGPRPAGTATRTPAKPAATTPYLWCRDTD